MVENFIGLTLIRLLVYTTPVMSKSISVPLITYIISDKSKDATFYTRTLRQSHNPLVSFFVIFFLRSDNNL